jgi:hypothetical protein
MHIHKPAHLCIWHICCLYCRGDPSTLSYVIQAVNKYTDAKRSQPTPKRNARSGPAAPSTPSSSSAASALSSLAHAGTPASINSVVHLLESTDLSRRIGPSPRCPSPSSTPVPLRWQCRHCSFVYEGGEHTEGGRCFMCAVGTIGKARVGAQTNPDVFKSAMDVANKITMAEQAKRPQLYTSINRTRAYVPDVWPRGRNCDACNHCLAVMYCSLCTYTHTCAHQRTHTALTQLM